MSLFKFGFSSSENRESSSLLSRKRPSDALTEEKTKERNMTKRPGNDHFRNGGKKIVHGLFTMKKKKKKTTMHCQWCMDYAADSDKKSLTNKFI